MRKSFLIARANLRKAKGQTAAIVVLILLAATMLNLLLMLTTDYKANFNRYHDKLSAEHVAMAVTSVPESREFLNQTLAADENVERYEITDAMHMTCSFPYNGGEASSWFVFSEKQAAMSRSIGKIEITEEGESASGIYLPLIYKTDEIKIGGTVELTMGSNKITYTVCGFLNSVMMGSQNCVLTQMLLTSDKYAELKELAYVPGADLCSVRLKNADENLSYETALKNAVTRQFPNITAVSTSFDVVAQSRFIAQMVCSGILSAAAVLVLLIAIVVIVSNIVNYIQVNMKNLGALKAMGYTSRQLMRALLLQFTGVALITSVFGAALSYALFPALNVMMIAQTGIPYVMHFLPLPFFATLIVLAGAVAIAVWLSSRKIKKIEPIVALRSGVLTHNFRRNRVPLDKTKAPLSIALALKTTLSGIKHNLTVGITMLSLSMIVVFAALATADIIIDMTPFLNLIVGESADCSVSVAAEAESEFLEKMRGDGRVEKIYLYSSSDVSHAGGTQLFATVCDDFSLLNNQSVVFKGRFPRYDNEIALGAKYAREHGYGVGDEIEITANGNSEKYLISGFTQTSNFLGRDCLFTRAGYEKIGGFDAGLSYYFNLSSGADIDKFNSDAKALFADKVNSTMNIRTYTESNAEVYISLITMIVAAILVLTALIIAFVLYLLVRTLLNNKKRDYGIQKALGYTTRQLILQTALSFMPALIISTVIGLIISSLLINPLLSVFLSGIGIVKCTFPVPVGLIAVFGAGMIALSFVMTCLMSLGIKKITPRNLLSGE